MNVHEDGNCFWYCLSLHLFGTFTPSTCELLKMIIRQSVTHSQDVWVQRYNHHLIPMDSWISDLLHYLKPQSSEYVDGVMISVPLFYIFHIHLTLFRQSKSTNPFVSLLHEGKVKRLKLVSSQCTTPLTSQSALICVPYVDNFDLRNIHRTRSSRMCLFIPPRTNKPHFMLIIPKPDPDKYAYSASLDCDVVCDCEIHENSDEKWRTYYQQHCTSFPQFQGLTLDQLCTHEHVRNIQDMNLIDHFLTSLSKPQQRKIKRWLK